MLLLSIAMVVVGYYFWNSKTKPNNPVNVNLKFQKDSAISITQLYYNEKADTAKTIIKNIECISYNYKSTDTVMASFTIIATAKNGNNVITPISYKYVDYWKYYYANNRWIGIRRNTAW